MRVGGVIWRSGSILSCNLVPGFLEEQICIKANSVHVLDLICRNSRGATFSFLTLIHLEEYMSR